MSRFAIEEFRMAVANLTAAYPDLADDTDLLADVLEGETDFHGILSRLVREKREADAMAEACKVIAAEYVERRKRHERRGEASRQLMLEALEIAGQRSVRLPEGSVSIIDPRPSVDVVNVDALPQGYFSIERKADRAAIKAAIEAGEDIPGACLKAGKTSVRIS